MTAILVRTSLNEEMHIHTLRWSAWNSIAGAFRIYLKATAKKSRI